MSTNIVLITGANQGIGFEIARALGSEAGYHILVGSRNIQKGQDAVQKLQNDGKKSVEAIQIDVTDTETIHSAVESVTKAHGRLDVLINNAGFLSDREQPADQGDSRDIMQQVYNTNVTGVAQVTNSFLPLLRKSSDPRIINITSSLGSLSEARSTQFYWPVMAYRTSKAALNMLTIHYARTLEKEGIKVNACCPGFCKTEATRYDEHAESAENGAINAFRLVTQKNSATGTFTNKEGEVAW